MGEKSAGRTVAAPIESVPNLACRQNVHTTGPRVPKRPDFPLSRFSIFRPHPKRPLPGPSYALTPSEPLPYQTYHRRTAAFLSRPDFGILPLVCFSRAQMTRRRAEMDTPEKFTRFIKSRALRAISGVNSSSVTSDLRAHSFNVNLISSPYWIVRKKDYVCICSGPDRH